MAARVSNRESRSRPRILDVPGGRLAYETRGTGAPVVFIHSVIADRRMWDRDFSRIAKGHQAVRYNLRGFGESSAASEPFSNTEDLHSLLAALNVPPATLVGSSAGGGIAIDYALDHPERVGALVLVAPGLSGGILPPFTPEEQTALEYDDSKSQAVAQAWSAGDPVRAFELLRELWCSQLQGPELELFRTMVHENVTEVFASPTQNRAQATPAAPRLPSLRIPTTVLVGDRDNPSMPVFARRIVSAISGARLVTIPGADHLVNLSQPDAFAQALLAALPDVPPQ